MQLINWICLKKAHTVDWVYTNADEVAWICTIEKILLLITSKNNFIEVSCHLGELSDPIFANQEGSCAKKYS